MASIADGWADVLVGIEMVTRLVTPAVTAMIGMTVAIFAGTATVLRTIAVLMNKGPVMGMGVPMPMIGVTRSCMTGARM